MGTQKLSEVGQNSGVNRITSDHKRTIIQAQPKDIVSVSKKTQVSKTEDLKETAKMLNFKKSLDKLAEGSLGNYDLVNKLRKELDSLSVRVGNLEETNENGPIVMNDNYNLKLKKELEDWPRKHDKLNRIAGGYKKL